MQSLRRAISRLDHDLDVLSTFFINLMSDNIRMDEFEYDVNVSPSRETKTVN